MYLAQISGLGEDTPIKPKSRTAYVTDLLTYLAVSALGLLLLQRLSSSVKARRTMRDQAQ